MAHSRKSGSSHAAAGLSPRPARKRPRSRSSAAMLTALTNSKKPHQIATGFDQSSHATLIEVPPRALPNAHESVIRPTYKARSSQTARRAFRFDPGALVGLHAPLNLPVF